MTIFIRGTDCFSFIYIRDFRLSSMFFLLCQTAFLLSFHIKLPVARSESRSEVRARLGWNVLSELLYRDMIDSSMITLFPIFFLIDNFIERYRDQYMFWFERRILLRVDWNDWRKHSKVIYIYIYTNIENFSTASIDHIYRVSI